MKEILTCDVWTGAKIKVVIDRETGEFVLYNFRFRLVVRNNKAFLMFDNGEVPFFTGYLRGKTWFFKVQDYVSENEDPYVAVIQMLYDIIHYC